MSENGTARRRVVVTGIGMVSALGNDAETSWARLIAGESGAAEITQFDHEGFPVHFACELKEFEPTTWIDHKSARRMDRFAQMILTAARQAKCTGYPSWSNCVISAAPDSPARSRAQLVSASLPSAETIPIPVTTTRLLPVPFSLIYIPSPPSTSSTSPVMNEASSEQRNRTAPATSSGSPSRPSGVFASIWARPSSGITSVRRVFT